MASLIPSPNKTAEMSSSKHPTVEAGSPSPPPLPSEPLPLTTDTPIDQPIASLGEDDEENEEENESDAEWDPSEERLPGQGTDKEKGKGKYVETDANTSEGEQPWQAVWAPEQNAWYFWHKHTNEVTWTNPLDPNPTTSTPTTTSHPTPTPAVSIQPPLPTGPPPPNPSRPTYGLPPDIDPDLVHLLPAEQRGGFSASGDSNANGQTALFNARTGRFTANDYAYTVDHLDEYNRFKRMGRNYFDVDAWEKEKAEEHAKRKRDEESGVVRESKITKKDMERFKKKKAEQRYRNQAWLRD